MKKCQNCLLFDPSMDRIIPVKLRSKIAILAFEKKNMKSEPSTKYNTYSIDLPNNVVDDTTSIALSINFVYRVIIIS